MEHFLVLGGSVPGNAGHVQLDVSIVSESGKVDSTGSVALPCSQWLLQPERERGFSGNVNRFAACQGLRAGTGASAHKSADECTRSAARNTPDHRPAAAPPPINLAVRLFFPMPGFFVP
jgi:hypothetical protein